MKILTILGTRPEIIRLSRIIPALDALCDHVLVHTGQNFDHALSKIFFDELEVREPDHFLGIQATAPGEQIGRILAQTEQILLQENPDRLLLLGDTNSALSAIIAKRQGVPVFHMEAGNRCYDDRVPEEVNRRIIDHSSDILMPYTERSRQNLLREGIAGERIFVTGNPILEVIRHFDDKVQASGILGDLDLKPSGYFLVTAHRAENVDVEERLRNLVVAFERLEQEHGIPVVVSTHPRTRARMQAAELTQSNSDIRFLEPFGFPDFISLEKNARCVLTDSGTVQEECSIFGVPNVTLRDVTERPETMECGSNILSGAEPDAIMRGVATALALDKGWTAPAEYLVPAVSDIVVRLVLGYHHHI